jgi:arylsulfatase A-like enzyme
MVSNLVKWIERDTLHPFFAVVWTVQTHFPYLSSRVPAKQVIAPATAPSRNTTEYLNTRYTRYLRSLHETDQALGSLFRQLAERRLLASTLVVILGDHGEAFGQHGHMFHRLLYEEEVRVPLVLSNPRLFHGEVDSTLGGTIDIAPTVMDLLGYPIAREWQGRSLFDRDRARGVYLFGPYSGLFGYRQGSRKLIYNPISGESELYDLATDPEESSNLASRYPELVHLGRERLAAWVQYQNRFYLEHGVSR